MEVKIICPVCDSKNCQGKYEKWGYKIFRCFSCTHVFVDAKITEKRVGKLYKKTYFKRGGKYHKKQSGENMSLDTQTPNYKNRIKLLQRFKDKGKLLDVGCAEGFFLKTAEKIYDVEGIEISKYASVYAKKNLKLNVKEATLQDFKTNTRYDIITLWDVIEHLPNPIQQLRIINGLIKKEGVLVLSTGDISSLSAKISGRKWHLMTPPQHLQFFSKKSLINAIERSGFSVEKILYRGEWVSFGYALFKLRETTESTVVRLLYKFVKKTGIDKLRMYINLLDVITLIAKKQ